MTQRVRGAAAIGLMLALLGGCFAPAHLPPEDRTARDLPTPTLLPLSQVIAGMQAQADRPRPEPGLEARAAALNARAARLRAMRFDADGRAAMEAMQARHR